MHFEFKYGLFVSLCVTIFDMFPHLHFYILNLYTFKNKYLYSYILNLYYCTIMYLSIYIYISISIYIYIYISI